MSDPSLGLQKAIRDALLASPEMIALTGRIYDAVPKDAAFPYITIGECQVIGDDDECGEDSDVHVTIHAWSRAVGFPEVKSLVAAIRSAMRAATLIVSGFALIEQIFVQHRVMRDPDGLTSHGIVEYRFLISHNS